VDSNIPLWAYNNEENTSPSNITKYKQGDENVSACYALLQCVLHVERK
jgi:hypothetical protein